MALASQLFDVLNKVTIDAIISPFNVGERALFHNHMLHLLPNDLLLLDHGYPAYWIFNLIMKQLIEIGNFSGTTVLPVYQDFHSKVLAENPTWVLASSA